jgi:pyruvyltransferase
MLAKKGIKKDAYVKEKKHLFTVGSMILGSDRKGNYQNATIWGSGVISIPTARAAFFQRLSRRKLDIRAVRGPLTKEILERFGHKCPEVYGDPAILMPLIYQPKVEKRYPYSVVLQFYRECKFREEHPNEHMVSMNTNDYKTVIDEIVASNVVYTSSLHGIILAEAYGVPAVFFRGLKKKIDFKYLDYYFSTGRRDIVIAETFEEALKMKPLPLPDFSKLRQGLLDSFPYDLWD